MHISFSTLAVAASLLASPYVVHALVEDGIPPDTPVSSLLSSAHAHLSRGETSEALFYYDAAIARDPSNYLTLFKRATTYLSLGRTNQATNDFNKVLSLQPGFEGANVQLAKIRLKLGDWEGAKGHFADGGRSVESPEITEIEEAYGASKLGLAAEKAGDWEACVHHLSAAITVAPRAAPLRESRAHCRIEMGTLDTAVSDLQSVLHLSPGNITPHVQIAAMLFYSLGDTTRGMEQTRKCLHSDPDSKACSKLLRQQKRIDKVLAKAAQALEGTRPLEAVKSLVDSKDEPGLITDIEEQTNELRAQGYIPAKGPIELHTRVVEMACEGYYKMNSKKAPEFCAKAVQANGDSFYGLLQQGKDRLETEDFEAAVGAFEKAWNARPDKEQVVRPLLDKAKVALKQSRTKDYYKVLEVPRDADERQIKSAYRKASKKYHPDKAAKLGATKEEAEKKMSAINEAYEVLSDPELKDRFDRGDDPNDQSGQSNPFQGNPFGGGGGGHPFFFQGAQGGQGGRGGGGQKFQWQHNGF